jgi:hypothetical protein
MFLLKNIYRILLKQIPTTHFPFPLLQMLTTMYTTQKRTVDDTVQHALRHPKRARSMTQDILAKPLVSSIKVKQQKLINNEKEELKEYRLIQYMVTRTGERTKVRGARLCNSTKQKLFFTSADRALLRVWVHSPEILPKEYNFYVVGTCKKKDSQHIVTFGSVRKEVELMKVKFQEKQDNIAASNIKTDSTVCSPLLTNSSTASNMRIKSGMVQKDCFSACATAEHLSIADETNQQLINAIDWDDDFETLLRQTSFCL